MNAKHLIKPLHLVFGFILLLLPYLAQSTAAAVPKVQGCVLSDQSRWSASENWVWKQVRLGKTADLLSYRQEGDNSENKKKKLSAGFIETLLLEKSCQNEISRSGVHISGAWFTEILDLNHAVLSHPLFLVKTQFDKDLIMDSLKSAENLWFSGSTFNGVLHLNGSVLSGNLFLNDHAEFDEVQLASAKISGQLDMTHARYTAPVDMDALELGDSLFMQSARFEEAVDITYATIGSVLVLPGDYRDVIDLSGTKIGNELRLSRQIGIDPLESPALIENGDAKLILRSTTVASLQDRNGSWPVEIELDGFTYARLGGYVDESGGNHSAPRTSEWFIAWLAKDESYTAQPYRQLAAVLQKAGLARKARHILYAAKEQERIRADGIRWLGLSILNYTMGYGYRYSYAFAWVLALVLIGATLLKCSGEGKRHKMPYGIAYSLDMLLPIVQLRKYHYDEVRLKAPLRHYFYFHMLMGYMLASFLVAGLSGLTK